MTGARIIALNENSYFRLLSVLKTSTNAKWIKADMYMNPRPVFTSGLYDLRLEGPTTTFC